MSNPRRSQGRDVAVIGINGSLAYLIENVWHVEQFSAICLISLDIPGQKTRSLALLIVPCMPI